MTFSPKVLKVTEITATTSQGRTQGVINTLFTSPPAVPSSPKAGRKKGQLRSDFEVFMEGMVTLLVPSTGGLGIEWKRVDSSLPEFIAAGVDTVTAQCSQVLVTEVLPHR